MSKIVITGASGGVATATRPYLSGLGHEIVLVDIVKPTGQLAPDERYASASIADPDALLAVFQGADLVVHLAGHPDARAWDDLLHLNIDGTQKVLQAGSDAGVPRVLLASSNHAVGQSPVRDLRDVPVPLPRPDTFYGVSKVAMEALGSLYADRFAMSIVSARIGGFRPEPEAGRALAMWLSPGDMARLVLATLALDSPGHHIVWGVSRNFPGWVDRTAGSTMGFDPLDDSYAWAAANDAFDTVPPPDIAIGGDFVSDGEPQPRR